MSTNLATRTDSLRERLIANRERLEETIPELARRFVPFEMLLNLALNDFATTPKLRECNDASILGALMECAQVGLPPGKALGLMHLIPRKAGDTMVCHAEMGYKGCIAVATRPQIVTNIEAEVVCAKDTFEYQYGTDKYLKHIPALNDRGELLAAYAMAWLRDGQKPQFVVMDRKEIEKVKAVSAFGGGGPWKYWEPEMWKKTVIKRLSKQLPAWALPPEWHVQMDRENSREFPQFSGMDEATQAGVDALAAKIRSEQDGDVKPVAGQGSFIVDPEMQDGPPEELVRERSPYVEDE